VKREDAENAARELSSQPRGLVRLAVPMSFGLRWITPILPSFFRLYPEVAIDLHLSDAVVDLVGEGFDAALRIAVLPDSSLVARKLCPVGRFIVASPSYFAGRNRPIHPRELEGHHCLGYAYRPRRDIWRFSNAAGDEETVTPTGPLRVTNADALIPTILDGMHRRTT
jgi:DNA-binding transcriptional LysR family regulator